LPTEDTYLLVKPNSIHLADEVGKMIEEAGLEIVEQFEKTLTRAKAEALYAEHLKEDFGGWLIKQLTDGPVVVFWVRGENAAERLHELAGPRDPQEARDLADQTGRPSIRSRLATDSFLDSRDERRAVENVCHTPKPDAVTRELPIVLDEVCWGF
jgi:nucleoside diphosphate kinase